MGAKAIGAMALAGVMVASLVTSGQAQVAVDHDINGDGFGDLLVGVPHESVSGRDEAGAVNVIFGGPSGLKSSGNRAFSQAGPVAGALEAGDIFGGSVELVDIDADGFADAVIGSPGEAIGSALSAGMITVIPGSGAGLDLAGSANYRQGSGAPGSSEFGDFFGWDLAGGDFDNDGYDDVAASSPFEDLGSIVDAGAVVVFYGGAGGVDVARSQFFSQSGAIRGVPEESDFFGQVVHAADFDGDGYDDLAVGVPGEDVGSIDGAGAVNVIYGSPTGLTTAGNQYLSQAGAITGSPEANDLFGFSVGASDMNCDGRADLLVGAPNEDIGDPSSGGVVNAGTVHVILGSANGLTTAGDLALVQGRGFVPGATGNNLTGKAVAGGDFDDDDCGDLVFGSPVEDIGTALSTGTVTVVLGSPNWPSGVASEKFSQEGPVPGAPESDDNFGSTLAILDIDGDGTDDVVIGVPTEAIGDIEEAGGIVVLYGSSNGVTTAGGQALSQFGSIAGAPEAGDLFAGALENGAF